jgi:hypothetical protein
LPGFGISKAEGVAQTHKAYFEGNLVEPQDVLESKKICHPDIKLLSFYMVGASRQARPECDTCLSRKKQAKGGVVLYSRSAANQRQPLFLSRKKSTLVTVAQSAVCSALVRPSPLCAKSGHPQSEG